MREMLDPYSGFLLLINREHPLRREPALEDLAPVDPAHPQILLHRQAQSMLAQLLLDIGGLGAIVPVSGYRPLAEQQQLYADALREHGEAYTRAFVAPPLASEHQAGLAIDLAESAPVIDPICPAFPDRGICRRFKERAARYGFILRYPPDKTEITGIASEPWHFRYVGYPHARIIQEQGLVLEEYLPFLRRYTHDAPLAFPLGGGILEIFTAPPQQARQLAAQSPGPCQISGDNDGGFVITRIAVGA